MPGTGALIAAIATGAEVATHRDRQAGADHVRAGNGADGGEARNHCHVGRSDRHRYDRRGASGLNTIMVLSGSTNALSEAVAYGPDFIFEDIAELTQAWQAVLA